MLRKSGWDLPEKEENCEQSHYASQLNRRGLEHDPLTGLPNRRELFTLLNAAIERAKNESYLVGVLFLDIDNFKYINDSMGHAFGDRVLVSLDSVCNR
jgi:diguanylate cyclase (GGDEF)-like protein